MNVSRTLRLCTVLLMALGLIALEVPAIGHPGPHVNFNPLDPQNFPDSPFAKPAGPANPFGMQVIDDNDAGAQNLQPLAQAQGRGGRQGRNPFGGRGGQPQGNPFGGQGQPGQGQGNPFGGGQAQPQGGGMMPGSGNDYFNLGPIGLMGMPVDGGIEIKIVEDGSRAEKAGLRPGMIIVGAGGREFRKSGDELIHEYGEAFDSAEESRDAELELKMKDDREVTVKLDKTGKANTMSPGDKSEEAFKAACKFLMETQRPNGSWNCGLTNGVVVVTSLAGLVLMASGDSQYRSNIDKAAEYVMENAGKGIVLPGGMGGRPRQQFDPEALERMAREQMRRQGMSEEEIDRRIEEAKRMLDPNGQGGGQNPFGGGRNPFGGQGGGNNPGGQGMPGGGQGAMPGGQGAMPGGSQNPTDPDGGSASWDQTNWALAYGSWFIAQWNHAKPNAKAKEALQRMADKLVENQVKGDESAAYSKGGGWAHGPAKDGPNALDYLELEIMSNYALAALAFADHAGCKVDKKAIRSAQSYISDCTTPRGGVAYSTRVGQYPGTAEPGRTSGALFAMHVSDADNAMLGRMAGYVKSNVERIPFGHGSPTMHMLAGALGSNVAGEANFRAFWQKWRIRIMLSRCENGRMRTWPTAESQQIGNTDITCGDTWTTANLALILGLNSGKVPLLQGKLRKRDGGGSDEPEPETEPGAETTDGPSSEPQVDEPKPIRYKKGTEEYDKFMNLLSMCVPRGHRALKADSVTESIDMLSRGDREKLATLANRMSRQAQGDDRDLLREFRRMAEDD